MSLTELVIPPDQSAYAVTDGKEVVGVQLDGGAARYRRDILGATSRVTVQWSVGPDEYKYLRAFYRAVTISGSTPFNIGLLLDEPEITTHKSYFVPGSMALKQQQGLTFVVGAELEVYPAEVEPHAADYVYVYNAFGKKFAKPEELFDNIVNTLWPAVL